MFVITLILFAKYTRKCLILKKIYFISGNYESKKMAKNVHMADN